MGTYKVGSDAHKIKAGNELQRFNDSAFTLSTVKELDDWDNWGRNVRKSVEEFYGGMKMGGVEMKMARMSESGWENRTFLSC